VGVQVAIVNIPELTEPGPVARFAEVIDAFAPDRRAGSA
jgi:hypothetical protein